VNRNHSLKARGRAQNHRKKEEETKSHQRRESNMKAVAMHIALIIINIFIKKKQQLESPQQGRGDCRLMQQGRGELTLIV